MCVLAHPSLLPSTRNVGFQMKSLVQSSLTARQARFIEEFLVDANGTQAAIRAWNGARRSPCTGLQGPKRP